MDSKVEVIEVSEDNQDHPEADVIEQEDCEAEQTSSDVETSGEDNAEDGHDDEVAITIDGESPAPEEKEPAPAWVKELRKQNRELARQNRELQAKQQIQPAQPKTAVLGPKPTLEGCDYDGEAFAAEMEKWYATKQEVAQQEAKAKSDQESAQKSWQTTLESYATKRAALKVPDYEDAEEATQNALNVTQQGILLQGADNPAHIVYALGKNPKKAAELAAITDPVKFAFAVAKLEQGLKVTNRKASKPAPEKTLSGSGAKSGTVDSNLDRLRAEAAKTGDYTKVVAFKRQLKDKSK